MLTFLKRLFVFRMAQTSSRGAARMVGLGRLATVIGLIGGYRAMKKHSQAH
ncbi:MAG TPA: hypothetical protein VFN10_00220 [Thermoanaerobaculia bacterium]|nr:hypothetical protein [Thermoanaerobaculia bacterium]